MTIRSATPADAAAIEALLDASFGPTRHARTASLLRRGARPIEAASLVACGAGGVIVGSIQFWPIALVSAGAVEPLTLLGPVAIAPAVQSLGLGRQLLAASLVAADKVGLDPILLIGDLSYYGPFGFSAAATAGWSLPGPVERERLLLRRRAAHPLPREGAVVAAAEVRAPVLTVA